MNDPAALAREIGKAGAEPEVVLEATYSWCPRDSTARTDSQRANTTHRYRPHSLQTPSEPACVNRSVGIVTGTERDCDRPCGRRAPASARRRRPAATAPPAGPPGCRRRGCRRAGPAPGRRADIQVGRGDVTLRRRGVGGQRARPSAVADHAQRRSCGADRDDDGVPAPGLLMCITACTVFSLATAARRAQALAIDKSASNREEREMRLLLPPLTRGMCSTDALSDGGRSCSTVRGVSSRAGARPKAGRGGADARLSDVRPGPPAHPPTLGTGDAVRAVRPRDPDRRRGHRAGRGQQIGRDHGGQGARAAPSARRCGSCGDRSSHGRTRNAALIEGGRLGAEARQETYEGNEMSRLIDF